MENYKSLDSKVKKLWYFVSTIIIVITLACFMTIFFLIKSKYRLGYGIPVGIIELLIITISIMYPHYKFKMYHYFYDDKKIYIENGVIFRQRCTIPICQIQDLHIYNGPIMTLLNLSGVIISTAGSNFMLGPIGKSDANSMVEELLARLESRLGEKSSEEI